MENYRSLYKLPAKSAKQRSEKREDALRDQKKKREDTFFGRRRIHEDQKPSTSRNLSPAPKNVAHETRREKLLRWKAEKEKLIAQQKLEKKKPPFKVGVFHPTINPAKEPAATTLKSAVAKKAAAETRLDAVVNRKAKLQTVAASSLAALSGPGAEGPAASAVFSGRVTRSKTAAIAAASKSVQDAKANIKQPKTAAASSKRNSTVKTSCRKPAGTSKFLKERLETSFAPKNHKFKAPVNLTLPTTPLTLKRKAAGIQEAHWPHIAGISILQKSPTAQSSKLGKSGNSVVAQRKGRLSCAVPKRTPKRSPPPVEGAESQRRRTRHSYLKTGSGIFMVTDMLESSTAEDVNPPKPSNITENNCSEEKPKSEQANTTVGNPEDSCTVAQSRRFVSSKKQQMTRGKENVPDKTVPDSVTVSLPQASMDPVIISSRRMSIHDPSPSVYISPDKLSNGMVPAQFSPFITSARGKDKYSIQKRRSSLIAVVPDLPPEELVRSRQTEHFRNLLERESSRLLALSGVWEERRGEAPLNIQDLILGPIGQARLLVKDKFQQFRRLIDKFETGDSEGKITVDDLTGFWEMMLLTVENVDKRFQELEDQRENNWEEQSTGEPVKKTLSSIAPVASKPLVKKNTSVAPMVSKRPTEAQSRLKDIIEAARKRRKEKKQNQSTDVSKDVAVFDGGFFKVESPKKLPLMPKLESSNSAPKSKKSLPSTLHQRSLLQQVLTNSAAAAHNSPLNRSLPLSPSPKVVVAQMHASQLGKRMSLDTCNEPGTPDPGSPVLKSEPSKSILKSARRSARVNTSRNRVAFENLSGSTIASVLSPHPTPPKLTPVALRTATPGSRKRGSLIPRPIPTPNGACSVVMPKSSSCGPSKLEYCEDLIDLSSPKIDSPNLIHTRYNPSRTQLSGDHLHFNSSKSGST